MCIRDRYRKDDNLYFYRIDGSRNEIDHDKVRVRGFPALYLFPAGDKANPVEYVGERDASSLARFLKNFRSTVNSQHKKKALRAEKKMEEKERKQREQKESGSSGDSEAGEQPEPETGAGGAADEL